MKDGSSTSYVGANGRRLRALALATMLVPATMASIAAYNPVLAQAQTGPNAGFADLVTKVAPSVVAISSMRSGAEGAGPEESMPMPQVPPGSPFEDFFKDFFDRRPQQDAPRRMASMGSGFVIDPRGYIVTNNHVIADADEIKVTFSDDSEYTAKLIGHDTKTDLALLKIEGDKPFPAVEWADSDQVRIGDWMIAIGNPFGLGASTTAGIISARGRDIRAGAYDDFIQVDAAINRGNSGGPSFTLDGKVFGVNTAIFSPSGGSVGIGFAIPSNLARPVIASLMETGRVARGWLGVRIQSVTKEIADGMGLPVADGALVASVTPGGPAEQAGIEAGDVVLEFDHKRVTRMRSLPRLVAETAVGSDADVLIWHKGAQQTVKVKLGQLPDDDQVADLGSQPQSPDAPSAQSAIEDLGLTVSELTDALKAKFKIADSAHGLVVTEVVDNGPAAGEGLKPGDLIIEVGQEEVSDGADLDRRVKAAKEEGKHAALLLVDRQGDLRFVALRFRS
ncbi:serine protease Do [Arboricoccus pini]|uniref:Probable periplasmic serine endoprotease DegP-like n=1 Tax=Arboricoccus pini TaxID=1963835 RepID=A0A212QYV9_9PROT|nr:Do family serine endopeptidase [Arboricoccus pini]SNB64882.1 serine protease Do [Arboricoccus pini]